MLNDWRDISYLLHGSLIQQRAHACLSSLKILELLESYDATLVSTVCLDIDVPGSDLDIICEATRLDEFVEISRRLFGGLAGFNVRISETARPKSAVVQFFHDNFEIELFAQPVPVVQQNAFRHLMQIDRALRICGVKFKKELRSMKHSGIKTEPAVATLLHLSGDPYKAVLDLHLVSDTEIQRRWQDSSAT